MDEDRTEPQPQDPGTVERDAEEGVGNVRLLATQSALLLSSGVVGYVGAFGLNVLLARLLGQAGFGAWVVALAFSQGISTLGLFGAEWIVLRQGSYYQGTGDEARFRRTIHLALQLATGALSVLALALLILAPLLGRTVFHKQEIVPMLRIAAVMGPVMGIGQIMLYGTQAFRRMRAVALVRNILEPVFRLVLVGLALVVARSAFAAFLALFVSEVLLAAVSAVALNRRIPLLGPTEAIEQRELVKFAVPVWGSRLMEVARAQLFPILLGSLAALSSSAVYVASRRIAVAPSSIIAAMNQVYAPMGSNLFLQGRRDEYAMVFKSMAKWSFMLGLPLFCLQVAFPREILSLFGHAYRAQTGPLVLLAIGMLFNFGTGPVTVTLNQIGRPRLALLDYVLVLAVEIGLGIWLIPTYGVVGAAAARMVGTMLNNVVPLTQVWVLARIQPYRFDYWKPIAAGAAAVVVAKVVVALAGVGTGIVAGGVATAVVGATYLAAVLAFGLGEQDREALRALLRRARRSRAG